MIVRRSAFYGEPLVLLLTIDKLGEWELQANLSRLKVDTTINIPVTS